MKEVVLNKDTGKTISINNEFFKRDPNDTGDMHSKASGVYSRLFWFENEEDFLKNASKIK